MSLVTKNSDKSTVMHYFPTLFVTNHDQRTFSCLHLQKETKQQFPAHIVCVNSEKLQQLDEILVNTLSLTVRQKY